MRTMTLGVVVAMGVLVLVACSSECPETGPVEGWDPGSLGWAALPDDLVAVEHYEVPDPTGSVCETYVFLASDQEVAEAEALLRGYFEGERVTIREREAPDVLFGVSGPDEAVQTATWVRRFDLFDTIAAGLPNIDHLKQRTDVVIVLSITSEG